MEVGRPGPRDPVKTEWEANPSAPKPREEQKPEKNVGEQLNEMAGVQTKRNLFQENKKLDKEAFLKMFMEEIKYQDPTKPVDNEKATQQMAMFSQLEQQMQTNKNLEKLISSQSNGHLMALNLMGKEVSVDHMSIQHEKGSPSSFNFTLPKDAAKVTVKIMSASGDEVDKIDLGGRSEGKIEARWMGTSQDGKPFEAGKYFYAVEAADAKGAPITVENKISGKVTGVSSGDGGKTFIHVGNQKVDLMEIGMVKDPAPEAPKPVNLAVPDKFTAGTKSETKTGESANASKAPEVAVTDDVAKAIRDEKPRMDGMGDTMNPIMPIFSR